jgi:hypothetical protein
MYITLVLIILKNTETVQYLAKFILNKLHTQVSTVNYGMQSVKPLMSQETMKMVFLPVFIMLRIAMLGGTLHILQKFLKYKRS